MTFERVRQMALAYPGVEDGSSYGTPAFRVGKKLMARLWEDGETLVLKTDPYERDALTASEPEIFFVTDHYRNYPYVLVRLPLIEEARFAEVLADAWRTVAPKQMQHKWDADR